MMRIMKKSVVVISAICLVGFHSAYAETAQTNEFVVLTDIHFTPFTNCQQVAVCPLVVKLNQAPASEWAGILAASEKIETGMGQDSNYPLLREALDEAGETARQRHVQFVVVLGDLLGHKYREAYKTYSGDKSLAGYQRFVYKTYQFLNLQLKRAFPALSIYLLPGNNDSFSGDYVTQVNGAFFQSVGSLWSQLIQSKANQTDFARTFQRAGYDAVNISSMNIKLIMLNSNLFSVKAKGKHLDAAAMAQLAWLRSQLESAKQSGQMVLIAMHIPDSIDMYTYVHIHGISMLNFWQATYAKQFRQALLDYSPEVVAILTGHLHYEWMQVLRLGQLGDIPVIGTQAVSPIYGNEPGYKIFTYSPEQKRITDFDSYSF